MLVEILVFIVAAITVYYLSQLYNRYTTLKTLFQNIDVEEQKKIVLPLSYIPFAQNDNVAFYDSTKLSDYHDEWRALTSKTKSQSIVLNFELRPWLLTSNRDLVKDICINHHTKFKKAEEAYDFLKHIIGNGLLIAKGKVWRHQRRLITPVFAPENMKRLVGKMEKHTIARLKEFYKDTQEVNKNKPVDVVELFSSLTLEIIATSAFGVNNRKISNKLQAKIREVFSHDFVQYAGGVNTIPEWIYKRIPLTATTRYLKNVKDLKEITTGIVKRKKEFLSKVEREGIDVNDEEDNDDLLSLLITTTKELGSISDELLLNQSLTFLFAGHETTNALLSWVFYEMCCNHTIQDKVYAEVQELFKKKGNKELNFSDCENLTYIHYVIKEALRMHPPLYEVNKKAKKDVKCGDFVIPKGMLIAFNIYNLHRNPKYWDEPNTFKPERWSNKDLLRKNRYCYIPFSIGARDCVGRLFAETEAPMMIAHLMKRFTVKFAPGVTKENVGVDVFAIAKPLNLKVIFTRRK